MCAIRIKKEGLPMHQRQKGSGFPRLLVQASVLFVSFLWMVYLIVILATDSLVASSAPFSRLDRRIVIQPMLGLIPFLNSIFRISWSIGFHLFTFLSCLTKITFSFIVRYFSNSSDVIRLDWLSISLIFPLIYFPSL